MVKSVLQAFSLLGLSVAVHSFVITYRTPQQCGSVEIAWTRPSTSAAQLTFPLMLHILPFDSTPISQPITGWNASTGSGSASLPFNLAVGTQFLLAVTDQTGQGAGPVSNKLIANPSPDQSCLSTEASTPGHFQVYTTANKSDCPMLTVQWDTGVRSSRPDILAFSPGSYPVNMDPPSFPAPVERFVQRTGDFTSMSEVVVLFRENNTLGRTSQILTVGGADNDDCTMMPVTTNPGTLSTCGGHSSSQDGRGAGRVVGGITAGVIGLSMLLLIIFLYRRRRQRKAQAGIIPTFTDKTDRPPSLVRNDSINSITDSHISIIKVLPPVPLRITKAEHEVPQERGKLRLVTSRSISSRTISSVAHAGPVTFPRSPSAWRSGASRRSTHSTVTDETNYSALTRIKTPSTVEEVAPARPESQTLPTSYPATAPTTPTSRKSQRSEKRSLYIKLDLDFDTMLYAEMYDPRNSVQTRSSRKSRAKNAQ